MTFWVNVTVNDNVGIQESLEKNLFSSLNGDEAPLHDYSRSITVNLNAKTY